MGVRWWPLILYAYIFIFVYACTSTTLYRFFFSSFFISLSLVFFSPAKALKPSGSLFVSQEWRHHDAHLSYDDDAHTLATHVEDQHLLFSNHLAWAPSRREDKEWVDALSPLEATLDHLFLTAGDNVLMHATVHSPEGDEDHHPRWWWWWWCCCCHLSRVHWM